MRLFLSILLLALISCTKTTVQHPIQQQAFASQDICAQGPFTVSLVAPMTENPTLLRLGFAHDKVPAKIFYQIKIKESGKVLSNGKLEQTLTNKDGSTPKNPCLARTMPGPSFEEKPKEATPSAPPGPNDYVLVIIPDVREPQVMRLTYQELPKNNPSIDIPLKDVPAGSSFEVLFWSEEPYPLGIARIQASLIEVKEEFVPNPERVAARKERKEKREKREAEYALQQETERLTAAKERDKELELLGKKEPSQKDYFEAQRGKYLLRYNRQWERAIYKNKYSEGGKTLIKLRLSQPAFDFIQGGRAQIEAYYRWKDKRREENRDARFERRKEAVERYSKLEALHLKRIDRRDTRKATKQDKLKKDSDEYKDLNVKRGKRLNHYQKHLGRFERLAEIRTFGNSKPELFYKVDGKARDLLNKRAAQISAYLNWKYNKERERDQSKHERELKRQKEKLARETKRAEKLIASWGERLASLKKDDARDEQKIKGLKGDEKKELDYKRGKRLDRFHEKFYDDFNEKSYRVEKTRPSWEKLRTDVDSFYNNHQEQLDAFRTWKDEEQRRKKDAQEKARLAKEAKRAEKLVASWRERFASLKKADEKADRASKSLKGDEKKKSDYKRGKQISRFQKRFNLDYNGLADRGNKRALWDALRAEIEAFQASHPEQMTAFQTWKDEKRQAKKDARAKEQLAKEQKRANDLAAAWKERFASLKKADEKAELAGKSLKGAEKKKSDYKRGKDIARFYERFLSDYNDMANKSDALFQRWDALRLEIMAFKDVHQPQLYAYENWKYEKRQARKADREQREKDARIARTERAVKKEMARFARLAEHDAKFEKEFLALTDKDTAKRNEILTAWGKELESYQKHFNHLREQIYKDKRYTGTSSFYALATKVDSLYAMRSGTIGRYTVLAQEQHKSREEKREARRQKRQEEKGGTHKALADWEKVITEQKAILAKMDGLEAGSTEKQKLAKKRKSLLEKAIEDLLNVYNKTTPEGQQYLSKAYSQAMALQHDLIDEDAGPTPPPLPLTENPGRQPMDGAVWHNGYWKLENNKWVWKKGFWELPPGAIPQ